MNSPDALVLLKYGLEDDPTKDDCLIATGLYTGPDRTHENLKILPTESKLPSQSGVLSVGCLPSIDVFDSHHLQIRLITHGPVPSVNNKKKV